jgi:hypothetical protein
MTEQREYRYSPTPSPGPCPDHPDCLVLRCARWLCPRHFHTPINQRGQPRRYRSPACRITEHRRLHM